jgi:NTE family protein
MSEERVAASEAPRRVAIACQGGGSHTAFTAGVLGRLFRRDALKDREVVALSGTSGGAICALLAWTALVAGDPGRAGRLLREFWADNSATAPVERWVNSWVTSAAAWADVVAMPAVSPYTTPFPGAAEQEFRRLLNRRVDFDAIHPDADERWPLLLIGAVDVLSGEFRTFDSRRDRITADTILASAALPTLFRAVNVGGDLYWDGLFSQNPPVKALTDAGPDELWVIQINPQRIDTEPKSAAEIADRRNGLAGNLSLYQELSIIEKIDQLLDEGWLKPGRYKQIVVRIIELDLKLSAASKLDREPGFLRRLIEHGDAQATAFLAALDFEDAWRRGDADAVQAHLAHAAGVTSGVLDRLTGEVTVDLTRHQVVGDTVTWQVRGRGGDRRRGTAEARVDGNRITGLRLVGG